MASNPRPTYFNLVPMKNLQIYGFVTNYSKLANLSGVKLTYAITKNFKKASAEVENFEAGRKPSEAFQEYDKARMELAQKHAKKDENGEVSMKNGGREYDIESLTAFQKELEALREEHKAAYDEQMVKEEEFKKLMLEETSVEFHKVKTDNLPEEITTEQMEVLNLIEMIEE